MFTEAPGPIDCHNGVYFQKERTVKRPSLSSSPIPSFSFLHFNSLYLFLCFIILSLSNNASSQFSHLSLLRSHSLIALFSLCGKCQVCRWCYLHENWRTKATDNFSHLSPGLIFRRTAEDGTERQSLFISLDDCNPFMVQVHYLNR